MSDTAPRNQAALRRGATPAPARVAQPGELLFEFYDSRTHQLHRCELRDNGPHGVEAQFFSDGEFRIGRTFHQRLDQMRTPRGMAIAWAEEERKAIERGQ